MTIPILKGICSVDRGYIRMNSNDKINYQEEIKILDHLEYINNLCLQIKTYKNQILNDIYKKYIKNNIKNLTLQEFIKSIVKKEREQFNI